MRAVKASRTGKKDPKKVIIDLDRTKENNTHNMVSSRKKKCKIGQSRARLLKLHSNTSNIAKSGRGFIAHVPLMSTMFSCFVYL